MYGEPPLPFYQLTEVRQFLLSSTDHSICSGVGNDLEILTSTSNFHQISSSSPSS